MSLRRWINLTRLGLQVLKRYPEPRISKVNFALTMRCNHKCLSCNIWRNNEYAQEELTAADINRIIRRNELLWVSLTGGEPSLAQDFENILITCLKGAYLTNIVTNGELPKRIVPAVEKALAESRKQNSILVVHITLFGEPDKHNEMTSTPKSYEHLVETVHGLKAIGYPDRLIIGFEHMIGRNNNQEYKFIQYKANRENIGITFTMEQEAGYYQNINGGIPKLDIPRIHLTVNPIDIFKNTILLNSKRKAGCVAGDYSAWVTPDLNVYPCLFSMPDHKSFNLKDTDFNIKPRYFLIDKQWINKCSGCWTPCESFTMLLWRPWRIIKHGN